MMLRITWFLANDGIIKPKGTGDILFSDEALTYVPEGELLPLQKEKYLRFHTGAYRRELDLALTKSANPVSSSPSVRA